MTECAEKAPKFIYGVKRRIQSFHPFAVDDQPPFAVLCAGEQRQPVLAGADQQFVDLIRVDDLRFSDHIPKCDKNNSF